MRHFDQTAYLNEIEFCLAERDEIKLAAVLQEFGQVDKDTQLTALDYVRRSDSPLALPMLGRFASREGLDDDVRLKLYLTLIEMFYDHHQTLLQILSDDSIPVKTMFIEIAGEFQLDEALPIINNILKTSYVTSELKACLVALGHLGSPEAVSYLNEYLYAGDKQLITAAINAMAEVRGDLAIARLADSLGRNNETDALILQKLAKIQTSLAISKLINLLASSSVFLRSTAKAHLLEIGPRVLPLLFINLEKTDPDLLVHTLNVIGDIGDVSAITPILKFLKKNPEDANVRFAAYEALGNLPTARAIMGVVNGLMDSNHHVRVAAAGAVERNLCPALVVGLKNMIKSRVAEVKGMAAAILDARAQGVFLSLSDDNEFIKDARQYLINAQDQDSVTFFVELCSSVGREDLLHGVAEEAAGKMAPPTTRPLVYAVDDSKMMLRIYATKLAQLGYEAHVFEFPREALESMYAVKPRILLTDLNMPDMTGIDLTRAVKTEESLQDIPVIMITTQKDEEDRRAAIKVGVNGFLNKPFKDDELKAEIERLLV
ncbi:MAG: response regulator [Deltaproteobacteria bacterium]|nr:response regulator [Deltaproteobacteria bacterium]